MSPLAFAALVSAAVVTLATGGSPAAPPADDPCAFRETAVHVLAELAGDTGERATQVRRLLIDAGVGEHGFVPESCRTGVATPDPSAGPGTPQSDSGNGHCPETAAATLGWGPPNRESQFDGSSPDASWSLYDGPGHAGNGRRTPDAVSIADGILTITGTADGDAEGMAWNPGQKYGRWELCARSPRTEAASMHSLALLWPDDESNSPDEVDFMEIGDPTRQKVDTFLHYQGGAQDQGEVEIDATQWHAFAVEWTPHGITNYVDGRPWWHTSDTTHLPRGSMHMTIQLDYFGGPAAEAEEHVDWARQYSPGADPADDGTAPTSDASDPNRTADAGDTSTATGTGS